MEAWDLSFCLATVIKSRVGYEAGCGLAALTARAGNGAGEPVAKSSGELEAVIIIYFR